EAGVPAFRSDDGPSYSFPSTSPLTEVEGKRKQRRNAADRRPGGTEARGMTRQGMNVSGLQDRPCRGVTRDPRSGPERRGWPAGAFNGPSTLQSVASAQRILALACCKSTGEMRYQRGCAARYSELEVPRR